MIRLKACYDSREFEEKYTYTGNDLGAICTREGSSFVLWSPSADCVSLNFYHSGEDSVPFKTVAMGEGSCGTWVYQTKENLHGTYYDYDLLMGDTHIISQDPYARACGINGQKSMAVCLEMTNPPGFLGDKAPARPVENIIYELHVKEFSWDPSGGFPEAFRGKYKAFTCEHTTLNGDGIHPTGIDYLKKLGVTHIQIMPAFDFASVDESGSEEQFNWGYDPFGYNVPEGSYATDAHDGAVRIREFKEMVHSLHRNGFRVIMDVVYNHTYSLDSPLQKTMPWYYYRCANDGNPSNGSACGNDIASERSMCAKYIIDSVLYWAREYHIDGFRFDLMGLLDVALMNNIRLALDKTFGAGEKLVFGEPWAATDTAMREGSIPALKKNAGLLDKNVGIFCDNTRDVIKGHVFDGNEPGFVNGKEGLEQDILMSARAWCQSKNVPVLAPSQIISYVSAHDNWTLWDKLVLTFPKKETEAIKRAYRLCAGIYMTCQGSLFMLSGEEFYRTKGGLENSYNAPIAINRLDWGQTLKHKPLVDYYQGLIALRKHLPGLCDKSPKAFRRFQKTFIRPQACGYLLDNRPEPDQKAAVSPWPLICVIYNGSLKPLHLSLPDGVPGGTWELLADGNDSFLWKGRHAINQRNVTAAPSSILIIGQRGESSKE